MGVLIIAGRRSEPGDAVGPIAVQRDHEQLSKILAENAGQGDGQLLVFPIGKKLNLDGSVPSGQAVDATCWRFVQDVQMTMSQGRIRVGP